MIVLNIKRRRASLASDKIDLFGLRNNCIVGLVVDVMAYQKNVSVCNRLGRSLPLGAKI